MSNQTWVCWECRTSVRRNADADSSVRCAACGEPCEGVGKKVKLPPPSDGEAWERLREQAWDDDPDAHDNQRRSASKRRHEIEKKLADLERRPPSPENTRLGQELRRALEDL